MSAGEGPRRGNAKIKLEGERAAESKRALTDGRITEAKAWIEAEIAESRLKAGAVTFQTVLGRAQLTPSFLEKANRRSTKDSLRFWIAGLKDGGARKRDAKCANPGEGERVGELRRLRDDFIKLQTAYVLDHLKGNGWRRALERSRDRVTELQKVIEGLEQENASLRGKLAEVGVPSKEIPP